VTNCDSLVMVWLAVSVCVISGQFCFVCVLEQPNHTFYPNLYLHIFCCHRRKSPCHTRYKDRKGLFRLHPWTPGREQRPDSHKNCKVRRVGRMETCFATLGSQVCSDVRLLLQEAQLMSIDRKGKESLYPSTPRPNQISGGHKSCRVR
jgi:hypothetical protein